MADRKSFKESSIEEASYAVSDIRSAWERAWFERDVTPAWQEAPDADRLSRLWGEDPQQDRTSPEAGHDREAFYGRADTDRSDWKEACQEMFEPTAPDDEQAPDQVQSQRIRR